MRLIGRVSSLLLTLALLGLACLARPATASLVYRVSLDTSGLVGHPAGPFAIDFQLLDGAGTGDASTTVVVSDFQFGGGAPVGTPALFGDAAGSLAGRVALTDSAFLNTFTQAFQPGSRLGFQVEIAGGSRDPLTPDGFSFAILDATGAELPTLGPFDAFLTIDLGLGGASESAFASDPGRAPAGGGPPLSLVAPAVTASVIPEPSTLTLLGSAGAIALARARRRRAVPT
jgi:hypothetical protein